MAIGGNPVGNMVIKVDLDSAGVEKSMTGLQRQLRSSNKAMGAQLSAFERGEVSAEKYGVKIRGLTNRHKIQGEMVRQAQQRYDSMSETYGENSVKAQQAAQQVNEQISRYQETGRVLRTTQEEFKEFNRIQDIQSRGWYKAAEGIETFGGHMIVAGGTMRQTGSTLTKRVSLPLGAIGGIAISAGSDFEAGMSRVEATSGATASQMAELEDVAKEMGATTAFSASEVSEAFSYMALAGWEAEEMTAGIAGVMDLAAASGEDLALVSDIVTDGLTAFGLKAEESGRFADVLATASSNANTNVAGLGEAFKYVAPVAGALGYEVEDTAVALGLMANAGIKGSQAGTSLRTMMTNLASPTAGMTKAMEKYGISLTDSEGVMKSFDEVMDDLRLNIGHLDEEQQAQAASTIFGKEAMSGALAIINASEEDYDQLTRAISDSDGAAKEMADTMQDNLKGSVTELKSMLEGLFIELYNNLKPALEATVDSAKNLAEWFGNLSPKTQENIAKFGALAVAAGPALSMLGGMTTTAGRLAKGMGGLAKTIGLSKGLGVLGALANLGPLAVGGVAVAGLAAVAGGVYALTRDKTELYNISTDGIELMNEEITTLEESTRSYDRFTEKSNLTKQELAELNGIQKELNETNDEARIEELSSKYEEYAKKSGLTKDELKELFEASDSIIAQAPNVQTAISKNGEEFVANTKAVHDLIDSERELMRIEAERIKVEMEHNRVEYLKQEKRAKEEIARMDKEMALIAELNGLTQIELQERKGAIQDEINKKYREGNLTEEEHNKLLTEDKIITGLINGEVDEMLETRRSTKAEELEILETSKRQLAELNQAEQTLVDIKLESVGINEEGEKGLRILDESINKNKRDLQELEEKKAAGKDLTDEEKKRHNELETSITKQQAIKKELYEEHDITGDINNLIESAISLTDDETKKKIESLNKSKELKNEEGNIIERLESKNGQHDESIKKLQKQIQKHGDVDGKIGNEINSLERKKAENNRVIETILRELGLHDDVIGKIIDATRQEGQYKSAVDSTTSSVRSTDNAIMGANSSTTIGIGLERERSEEAGRTVEKSVLVTDDGTVAKLDDLAMLSKNKNVHLKEQGLSTLNSLASASVTKTVRLSYVGGPMPSDIRYARGTPPSGHKGGMAIVGDGGGRELIKTPDGAQYLSPDTDTRMYLPKGTQVLSHRDTERLLKATPKYASGTRGAVEYFMDSEVMKLLALNDRLRSESNRRVSKPKSQQTDNNFDRELLNATLEQNKQLSKTNEILYAILGKDLDIHKLTERIDEGLGSRTKLHTRGVVT